MEATSVALRDSARTVLNRYYERPFISVFQRFGIGPNAVTLSGLAVTIVAGVLAGMGLLIWAGVVYLFGSAIDLLDGALARATGRASAFGALLDSTVDRLEEAALLGGLAWWYAGQGNQLAATLAFVTFVASVMVSYMRARGEGLKVDTKSVGIMTRGERVAIMGAALLLSWVPYVVVGAMAVITVFGFVTMADRLFHIARQDKGAP
jgi:CDP-diacylglycerol--glycerol-3-phosphate 3-phosphatidyltransferase